MSLGVVTTTDEGEFVCCVAQKQVTFDKPEFAQVANPLLKLRFIDSVKFRTLLQHLEHTGGIQPQDEEHSHGRHDLPRSTASSQPRSGVEEVLCLGFCEAHIKQRAQGQFSGAFARRLTDSAVVLHQRQCAVRSAEAPGKLGATSPKLSSDDHRLGVPHSPVIHL